MSQDPLFSIIVPTYARPQMLVRAVESVRRQTVEDFECLIVNDAGPSPAALDADARFRILERERNGGQAASFNTGLEAARGQYVAFLDDDDEYTPERLEIALKGHDRALIAVCQSRIVRDGRLGALSTGRWEGDVSRTIREGSTPQMGRVSIPRDAVLRFDETFLASADVEWWIRTSRLGPVCTVDRLGLLYHVHSGPRSLNGAAARYRSQLRMLEVHQDYFSQNRRARAYQLDRIGVLALRSRGPREAVGHLVRSLLAWPSLRTLARLVKILVPKPRPTPAKRQSP